MTLVNVRAFAIAAILVYTALSACSLPNICANGGDCTELAPPDLFKCDCDKYFSGKRCEVFHNPCDVDPCLNGGSCYYEPSQDIAYICVCRKGFDGARCENELSYGIGGMGKPINGVTLVFTWACVVLLLLLLVYCLVMAILETIQQRLKKIVKGAFGGGDKAETT